jgi:hypothetical protein
MQDEYSKRYRSMTHLQIECLYKLAEEEEGENKHSYRD